MSTYPKILSQPIGDSVKTTTCYMCACRCGIKVHLKDGRIRYIEGNKAHPVNGGVLCGKGAAGIMKQESPAKLSKPLLRVGPRGAGEFREIEWDEALSLATEWLGRVHKTDPKKLAFFTGRDQSQSLTGWWAQQFGTPNYAAHGGFCSVNMAAAGIYTLGASFWEFGEPDFENARYFLMFGVAEDHSSNPLKRGLARLKARNAKFVSVNPVRTGYSAIADEWIGIRPGADGLFIFALMQELLKAGRIDRDFLRLYTNAGHLVIDDPGSAEDGLIARDGAGQPLCFDEGQGKLAPMDGPARRPALDGEYLLSDGRKARPAFALLRARIEQDIYAPEIVADRCGVSADVIRRIARELAQAAFDEELRIDQPWTDVWGRRHDHVIGRPVSFHAMRGISAHANGFQTCRAIHLLQMILGAVDGPGAFRAKPPYPKPLEALPRPGGRSGHYPPGESLKGGPPLGYVLSPDDLLVDAEGRPYRIDGAYGWDAPLAAHGVIQRVIANAWKGDPYPIDVLMLFMANMSWNSSMNVAGVRAMLTDKDETTGEYKIPRIIYSDAFISEMVAYADLILPDTTYLERHDCISLLDRPISDADGAADAIRQPIFAPDRDVRPFQDVLLDLGARLGLPGMTDEQGGALYPGGFAEYMFRHERLPGVGMLAGWRGSGDAVGKGPANSNQLDHYKQNDCFFRAEIPLAGRFYKFANQDYQDWALKMGFLPKTGAITLNLYLEPMQHFRLAARGHGATQPPASHRARIEAYFDPLPFWHATFEDVAIDNSEYPLHAITQRPMIMYHSWDSQNAWQRQILGHNRLFIHTSLASALGLKDEDWVWIISRHARVKARVKVMRGCNPNTVWTWNAVGKQRGAWGLSPNAPEATKGFLLNHLIADDAPPHGDEESVPNADPVTGQAAWYDLRVRIEKCAPNDQPGPSPDFEPLGISPQPRPSRLRYGPGKLGGHRD